MTDIKTILKENWGYDSFRPLQQEVIENVMAGRDTVALMPTGAGKSLTYQVPAIALDGVTIVISPLISLMLDQVAALKSRGIVASFVNSSLSSNDIDRILDNCVYGDVKLLYIAPERLDTLIFKARVRLMRVSLVAIDEAHCISQWGYDFRPSYLAIGQLRELLPNVPFLALTATATSIVLKDIALRLSLHSPSIFRGGFERDNIRFVVREVVQKLEKTLEILKSVPEGSAVIYCRTRAQTIEVAKFLCENGENADFYHAGLDTATRTLKQKAWMNGTVRTVVATSAFGMGIDKPDVRIVIHYNMPDTLEDYYQQAGRAGRDGKISYAVALFCDNDLKILNRRVDDEYPPLEFVRQTYDNLCRFLGIPLEYGEGVTRKLNLVEYSKRYKVHSSKVKAALSILASNGYLKYYEEYERPTKVKFNVSRDELYKQDVANPTDDRVIAAILRNYTGLFNQYTGINEEYVARVSGVSLADVTASFICLSRTGVIKYIPRNSDPEIRFETDRIPMDYIRISPESYLARKNNLRLTVLFVQEYLLSSYMCRMKMLCRYFDQEDTEPCGKCDVCGLDIPSVWTPPVAEAIDNEILEKLDGTRTMEQIRELLPYPMYEILLSLRRLLWKGKVYEMSDGSLRVVS